MSSNPTGTVTAPDPTAPPRASSVLPGLGLATAIAVVATLLGRAVPIVGGPVSAIVIGAVIAATVRPGARFAPGVRTASRTVLQLSVVVLGSQLSLAQIAKVGVESLPVMLGTLAVCLTGAWLIGRWLGIVGDLRTLIGVGTGICGASAIAAVTPVIGAVSVDVAYAISTIFVFNIAAVVLFPIVGHVIGLSQHAFGLFAGTAVNDMSSVVATATTYGPEAARYAVVVKLVRTLMIIPISLALAAWVARRARTVRPLQTAGDAGADDVAAGAGGAVGGAGGEISGPRRVHVLRLVPWFLVGFVVVAAVNSLGVFPEGVRSALATVSVFLITTALAAVGLSTDVAGLRRAGLRPLLLGACLWVLVSVTSLGLQLGLGLG